MDKVKFELWDKILANQPDNRKLFLGNGLLERCIYDAVLKVSGLRTPTERFRLENSEMFSVADMASTPVALGLFRWLIRLSNARRDH